MRQRLEELLRQIKTHSPNNIYSVDRNGFSVRGKGLCETGDGDKHMWQVYSANIIPDPKDWILPSAFPDAYEMSQYGYPVMKMNYCLSWHEVVQSLEDAIEYRVWEASHEPQTEDSF